MENSETETNTTVEPISTQQEEAPTRSTDASNSGPDDVEVKSERKKSVRSSLRDNLRKKDSETEAAAPSGKPSHSMSEAHDPILPPADMTTEEKANWSKLPPEAQRYLSRRAYEMRSSFTRKAQEIGSRERELGGILEAVAPVQDEYIRNGISTADVVRRAIAWDKAFKSDPLQAARQYLDSYGIDPSELLNGEPLQQPQQPLSQEEVREQIRQEMLSEFQRREQEVATHNNYNMVQQFLGSKPLFRDPGTAEQLEAAMAPIVAGLRQSNPELPVNEILDRAYNYVTRGDPQFSSLQQKLEAKAEAERAKAEAEKAMQASRSISGGPGSGSPQRKIKDIRENLRLRYRGAL
jgi:hypothetical protein